MIRLKNHHISIVLTSTIHEHKIFDRGQIDQTVKGAEFQGHKLTKSGVKLMIIESLMVN